ncbi:MAG: phosphoenolpyruvate--protein phosphotransferase [Pseudomonadota bacterium]
MTLALYGIGVSPGVAMGRAHVIYGRRPDPQEQPIAAGQVAAETRRFRRAVKNARVELERARDRLPPGTPSEISEFLDIHRLMLDDGSITEAPLEIIKDQRCNAEWALNVQRNRIKSIFDEMEDPYLSSRAADVDQVVERIQKQLTEERSEVQPRAHYEGMVLVADDVDPAAFLLLHQEGIAGLVTEMGGPLSHTAILARSLKMPAVMGLRQAPRLVTEGEPLVLDGTRGVALADPGRALRTHYRDRIRDEQRRQAALRAIRKQPACTPDGCAVTLQANVDLPEDIQLARRNGAQGVGLHRTEYLFLNRQTPPDEEEQYLIYADLCRKLKGRPITIRTLDLGADKQMDSQRQLHSGPHQVNPALGLRAVRLCLHHQELFIPQLRAILRASALGRVRILVPMLSNTQELHQVRALVHQSEQALRREGREIGDYELGGMIEVPAAALAARAFAKNLDFLSIGTNDLIQYTLAIDRIDDQVGYLYNPLHPSVLKLLQMTLDAANAVHTPVSLCGEMAGDVTYTRLLLGLGLRDFSMTPSRLLEVKEIINSSHLPAIRQQVRRILRASNPDRIESLVKELNAL